MISAGLHLLASLFNILGVLFLFAAAVGVLRFKDPLQRMHAATKAGTIGAGLVLAGTVVLMDEVEGQIIGVLAILFLFLTAPVASHLLGRAAYISGAKLMGIDEHDALRGVLERHKEDAHASNDRRNEPGDTLPPPAVVRFAVMPPHDMQVARRSLEIARANGIAVQARAIVDAERVDPGSAPDRMRDTVRSRLAEAVEGVQRLFEHEAVKLSVFYSEGLPDALVPDPERRDSLLVLPWPALRDQANAAPSEGIMGSPRLAQLARPHAGPVLFTRGPAENAQSLSIALLADGSEGMMDGLIWALKCGLWRAASVLLVSHQPGDSAATWQKRLKAEGLDVQIQMLQNGSSDAVTSALFRCGALVLPSEASWRRAAPAVDWSALAADAALVDVLIIPDRKAPG